MFSCIVATYIPLETLLNCVAIFSKIVYFLNIYFFELLA